MLEVKNLHVEVDGKQILKGLNISIKPGELHVIMGPNGSGKSTLSNVIAGREKFEVTNGDMSFDGNSILEMEPEVRAAEGIFLSFQYPVEIPGVSNVNFLRTAINEIRDAKGEEAISAKDFMALVREKSKIVELDSKLASRAVNEGFSGGEK